MQVLFFRHGIADELSRDGSDASRTLTDEGIVKTTEAAAGLRKLIDRPDVILTSPKLRAVQTAEILGKTFDRKPQVVDAIAQESPTRLMQVLGRRREEIVILVGHEPTLSRTAEKLLVRDDNRGFIQLKKAGCVCIELELDETGIAGHAELLWLATPKLLRAAK